ncbi:MAG: secondary thiamine-phosphate synthase enzyme YjbQ, partial [Candidatus Syntropharchaeales archaeon]
TVFAPGATGAVTTIEYESGLIADFKGMLERIAPQDIEYMHNLRWGDGNGHSHVRASLLGPGLTVPFIDGRLQLGTWQQIVFIDLDNRQRDRKLIVQIVGE